MTGERIRSRVFGEVADEYDRIRPNYPESLVDDVLAYAELDGAPALEVGAGTGKATLPFARRGVALTAVEPDEAMAAVLERRVAGMPDVRVVRSSFEDYRPADPFGLLFSAQAWHWTDPAVRWRRAASALAPGGALALFWNNDRPAESAVAEAIERAHREHAPGIEPAAGTFDEAAFAADWPYSEMAEQPDFAAPTLRLYRWTRVLSRADHLAFLATQSSYLMLDEANRTALLRALADGLGEQVVLDVVTALYLTRRLPD